MSSAYHKETGTWVLDETGTPVAAGKTVMVDLITYYGTTAGHQLVLTDGADKPFVDVKISADTKTVIIPLPKPRKLNGLKVATISSGVAYVYLAQG